MLFTSEKLCLIVSWQPQHGKLVGSDCLDNAVEPCGNVIAAELLFLHIAMPSHLRHFFKWNGGMHHIIESDGNVCAVSAHGTGNIEATLVHQLEQQRK